MMTTRSSSLSVSNRNEKALLLSSSRLLSSSGINHAMRMRGAAWRCERDVSSVRSCESMSRGRGGAVAQLSIIE